MPESAQPLAAPVARTAAEVEEALQERLLGQVAEAAQAIAANLSKFGAQDPPVHPAILHAAAAAVLISAHKLNDAAARLDALAGLGRPYRPAPPVGPAEVARLLRGIRALREPRADEPWAGTEVACKLTEWLAGLGIDPEALELPGGRA